MTDLERALDILEDLARATWEEESDMANDARRLIIAHREGDAERDIEWSERLVEEYEKGYEASRAENARLREEKDEANEMMESQEAELARLREERNGFFNLCRELEESEARLQQELIEASDRYTVLVKNVVSERVERMRLAAERDRLREENEDLLRGSGDRELGLAVDLHETKRQRDTLLAALRDVTDSLDNWQWAREHGDGRNREDANAELQRSHAIARAAIAEIEGDK